MRMPAPARLLAFAAVAIASPAFLFAQQAHINLDWAPHRASGSLVPFMANVISPEVSDQVDAYAVGGNGAHDWAAEAHPCDTVLHLHEQPSVTHASVRT